MLRKKRDLRPEFEGKVYIRSYQVRMEDKRVYRRNSWQLSGSPERTRDSRFEKVLPPRPKRPSSPSPSDKVLVPPATLSSREAFCTMQARYFYTGGNNTKWAKFSDALDALQTSSRVVGQNNLLPKHPWNTKISPFTKKKKSYLHRPQWRLTSY